MAAPPNSDIAVAAKPLITHIAVAALSLIHMHTTYYYYAANITSLSLIHMHTTYYYYATNPLSLIHMHTTLSHHIQKWAKSTWPIYYIIGANET